MEIDSLHDLSNLKEEDYHKITLVDLSFKSLQIIPVVIYKLSNLEELYLKGNNLTLIGNEIRQLSKLKVFDLQKNSIWTLSSEIELLKELQMLDLRTNNLRVITPWLKQMITNKKAFI